MPLILRKDTGLIPQVLTAILDHCVNGVTLADPDQEDCPIVYANKAFSDLTGYGPEDIIGKNCRFLQGQDKGQPEVARLREGIKKHEPVSVTLRNYEKRRHLISQPPGCYSTVRQQGRITLLPWCSIRRDLQGQCRSGNQETHRNAQRLMRLFTVSLRP